MASTPRFTLFIKKAGTCPFSQRAYMFMLLRVTKGQIEVKEVDISNKPKEFLDMNPGGKVPVLVDHSPSSGESPKIVPDSAEIVKYVDAHAPKGEMSDLRSDYEGEANSHGALFPLFAKYLKNKDPSMNESNMKALLEGMDKFEAYLSICVAGKELKDFEIPEKCKAIRKYMDAAKTEGVWKDTCPTNDAICAGWKVHL